MEPMTIIRIFDTTIEPSDVEEAKTLFREQVKPAFDRFEGCQGIEMSLGVEEHSKDLVDVAAISRWDSMASIERAIATDEYQEALRELRALFQETPLVRHFEKVE